MQYSTLKATFHSALQSARVPVSQIFQAARQTARNVKLTVLYKLAQFAPLIFTFIYKGKDANAIKDRRIYAAIGIATVDTMIVCSILYVLGLFYLPFSIVLMMSLSYINYFLLK
jgi:hypothetical protein